MTGAMLGQYAVGEKLGEGGMGEVWRGEDRLIGRPVALKLLRPELAKQPEAASRYRAEAQALARLNHPNIGALYSFFVHEGVEVMALEYLSGQTLEEILRREKRLAPEMALAYLRQMLAGLEHAHRQGVLHRDIKPSNLMVSEAGVVKIMDFGIARITGDAALTRRGRILGTWEYMAPERAAGEPATAASDVYSAAAVYCEMVTGQVPDPGRPLTGAWPGPVAKALARDPGRRFESAAEFLAALGEPERPVTVRRRWPAWAAGVAVLAAAAALWWSGPTSTPEPRRAVEKKIEAARPSEPGEADWMKGAVPVTGPVVLDPATERRRREALKALGVEDEAKPAAPPQ